LAEPGNERRRAERLRLRARAWCEGQGVTLFGRVGNVSQSGVFLLSSAPLRPGTRVKVAIPLNGKASPADFRAEAEVVWARGAEVDEESAPADRGASGLALRFLAVDGDGQERLAALLETGRPA
jgi:hypothetical protein